jgi:hypothetical protein
MRGGGGDVEVAEGEGRKVGSMQDGKKGEMWDFSRPKKGRESGKELLLG